VYRQIEMPLVPVLAASKPTACGSTPPTAPAEPGPGHAHAGRAPEGHRAGGPQFNLDSPKQLQAVLFDELKLPAVVKTPKGQPSTNEEALEAIADQHELPRVILDYRGLAKLRSTYTDKLPEMVNPHTGRVHTSYHQAGAAPGRCPRPTRTCRTSRSAPTTAAASAARSSRRKAAASSRSTIRRSNCGSWPTCPGPGPAARLRTRRRRAPRHRRRGVRQTAGRSHAERAPRRQGHQLRPDVRHERVRAGASARHRAEAQDYVALYFSRYPAVHDFMERMRAQAREQGYVETLFGRRLYLNDINARNQGLPVPNARRSTRRCRAPRGHHQARDGGRGRLAGRVRRARG
jgi:DNA polymerase-1